MQTKILIGPALLSAICTAQINNIDTVQAARGATDQANFYSSLATNNEYLSDILVVATAVPSSVINQDPASLASALQTGTQIPAWVSAIPTPVLNSLNLLFAAPYQADDDANAIATGAQASAIFANPALPTSVQAAFTSDPIGFIQDILTATTWPAWATSIPGPLQTQIGQVINQELNTLVADYEATYFLSSTAPGASQSTYRARTSSRTAVPTSGNPPFPSASGKACPTCPSCSPITVIVTVTSGSPSSPSTGLPKPSTASGSPAFPVSGKSTVAKGTASSSIVAFTGSKSGAPVAFTGAAAPMKTAAVGAAMLFAGAGAFLNA